MNDRSLSLSQFQEFLVRVPLTRQIDSVHLHHTWRPAQRDWRGAATIAAMRRFHMENRGFSDIAQHITIDPAGGIWIGRDFNRAPASSYGIDPVTQRRANGNAQRGPIMIELVGNFDAGKDQLLTPQRTSAVAVIASILKLAQRDQTHVVTHHQMDPGKSCPGTGLAPGGALDPTLLGDIAKALETTTLPANVGPAPASIAALLQRPATRANAATDVDAEVPEDARGLEAIAAHTEAIVRSDGMARGELELTPEALCALRPYVVNTAHGLTAEQGLRYGYRGTLDQCGPAAEAVDDVIAGVKQWAAGVPADQPLRLMIHAHGGLVDEKSALHYAHHHHQWWRNNHVYPIFMVWETGFWETLLRRNRGFFDVTDWLLEKATAAIGSALWRRMKDNARLCSAVDWQAEANAQGVSHLGPALDGTPGGARLFARELLKLLLLLKLSREKQKPDHARQIEIHAVGHSAGSIFHAHFLPMLLQEANAIGLGESLSINTLNLLAPAIRIDDFAELLQPLVPARIQRVSMFTMDAKREKDDDCVKIYRKSLLYLVRNAFEPDDAPLLGLQESIRADAKFSDSSQTGFFNTAMNPSNAVYWSTGASSPATAATTARRHGDFDNNAHTMTSVLSIVLGGTPNAPLGFQSYMDGVDLKSMDYAYARRLGIAALMPESSIDRAVPTGSVSHGSAARSLALCIGIDDYPGAAALQGCVNDARQWAGAFSELGFSVRKLVNSEASLAGLRAAISDMLQQAADGDLVAIQYAGHGTQFADRDGNEADGFDEALVPHDYTTAGCLLDDELHQLLLPHASRLHLRLFLDCCHAGSASRFAPRVRAVQSTDERVRYLAATQAMYDKQESIDARRQISRPARRALRNAAGSLVSWVHLAACTDQQFAYESAGQGDFTRVAVPLLRQAAQANWSAQQLLSRVRAAIGSRQTPQLMAAPGNLLERPLLARSQSGSSRDERAKALLSELQQVLGL